MMQSDASAMIISIILTTGKSIYHSANKVHIRPNMLVKDNCFPELKVEKNNSQSIAVHSL